MPDPVPNNLALSVINPNDVAQSAPLRNNYAAIQTAVNQLIACLAGGVAGQALYAVDGTDVQYIDPRTTSRVLASGKKTGSVTSSGTTFAAGSDVLAAALSFTADGTSDYLVKIVCEGMSNTHGVSR
jgi:hypothetical protein